MLASYHLRRCFPRKQEKKRQDVAKHMSKEKENQAGRTIGYPTSEEASLRVDVHQDLDMLILLLD